jgi:hypothetical protein
MNQFPKKPSHAAGLIVIRAERQDARLLALLLHRQSSLFPPRFAFCQFAAQPLLGFAVLGPPCLLTYFRCPLRFINRRRRDLSLRRGGNFAQVAEAA